jgi:hypothetical protein
MDLFGNAAAPPLTMAPGDELPHTFGLIIMMAAASATMRRAVVHHSPSTCSRPSLKKRGHVFVTDGVQSVLAILPEFYKTAVPKYAELVRDCRISEIQPLCQIPYAGF